MNYLENIPEDLLLEISLYSDAHDLLEIYKLFKPRLYDKLSFWYDKYSANFPDVDWIKILPDQKGYTFEIFYIIYVRFNDAYYETNQIMNEHANQVLLLITSIPYFLVATIKLKYIHNYKLLKFDYQNKFYKVKH